MIIQGELIKLEKEDDINTDLIIAGKYTKTLDMDELASHVFEDLDEKLRDIIKGKIIIAGENFGCGSSREQAPLALKYGGVKAIVAKSYARIFFRNAVNIGLPVIIADTKKIKNKEAIAIDLEKGVITNKSTKNSIKATEMPKIMIEIMGKGGLVKYLKEKGDFYI